MSQFNHLGCHKSACWVGITHAFLGTQTIPPRRLFAVHVVSGPTVVALAVANDEVDPDLHDDEISRYH